MSNNDGIKVKWLKSRASLSQVYSSGLAYSFVNENNEQCTPFCFCKDFMHDAVHALVNNKMNSIYGFKYDPQNMPHLSLDRTIIALANSSDKDFGTKIDNCLDFLNQIETKLKLVKTTAQKCANPQSKYKTCGVYIFSGSSRWLESPPMLSMYTLFQRVGFTHKKGTSYEETIKNIVNGTIKPYQSSDGYMLKNAQKGIDRILSNGYRKIFYKDIKKNYPDKVNVGSLHGSFGIVGFSYEYPKSSVPYWFKTKKSVKKTTAI